MSLSDHNPLEGERGNIICFVYYPRHVYSNVKNDDLLLFGMVSSKLGLLIISAQDTACIDASSSH